MKVYITIDVEVWCDSWSNIDHGFPEAFQRYIYSGLVRNIAILKDFGIKASFFVEPLFALRLGLVLLHVVETLSLNLGWWRRVVIR